jgi:hypothetical protein
MKTTPTYNYLYKTRDNPKFGGGLVIIKYKYFIFRDQSDLIADHLDKKTRDGIYAYSARAV